MAMTPPLAIHRCVKCGLKYPDERSARSGWIFTTDHCNPIADTLHCPTCFKTNNLDRFSDRDLVDELERRKNARKPEPAFKCHNCGTERYYQGSFSAASYERQLERFRKDHSQCLPIFNGGMI